MKSISSALRSRSGFTLLELIIFAAIFVGAGVMFLTILVAVTRIHGKQGSSAEVAQQSQYILQTVQQYVEGSSIVDIPADSSTGTLKLRMSTSSTDPLYIYASGTTLYLKVTDAGTPQPLSSARVQVSDLSFVRRTNPPSKDSVSVSFTVTYGAGNPQQSIVQALSTSVSRVSAATFDSDIVPSTTNLKIGTSGSLWSSINNLIYFSGTNVGFNVAGPTQQVEVNGGVRLNTAIARPSCDTNARGTLWFTNNGANKDTLAVCARSDSSTIGWVTLY